LKPSVPEDPRATDVLANERTFLAYARTSLAFIAFGFVIARFSLYVREIGIVAHISLPPTGISTAFGSLMAMAGVLCGLWGGYRYVVSARALRSGSVSVLPETAAVIGAVAIAIIGLIVAFALPGLH
jgi:putative membrane protein